MLQSNQTPSIAGCVLLGLTKSGLAALLTTAATWKRPQCPSADEWIKRLWYIDTVEYHSTVKGGGLSLGHSVDAPGGWQVK